MDEVVPISLLDALRSEEGVRKPDVIYRESKERAKLLRENGVLDKYLINKEEAATLCAIPLLLLTNFDFNRMVAACMERPPSKLMVLILIALRKLPEVKSVLYFDSGNSQIGERVEGESVRKNFIFASTLLDSVKSAAKKEKSNSMEVFRIENGKGYDIGDFNLTREQIKSKAGNNSDLLVMEPMRTFTVLDSGITKGDSGTSVVIVKMVDEKLIYEKEIQPGVCHNIANSVEENVKAFKILTNTSFDDCK